MKHLTRKHSKFDILNHSKLFCLVKQFGVNIRMRTKK